MYHDNSNQLVYTNELWFIKPDYNDNQRKLQATKQSPQVKDRDYDYKHPKRIPSLSLELIKLQPQGKPPMARCLHSATQFAKQYIAFFGGKNDKCFSEYKNIALNDLFVYDISKICYLYSFRIKHLDNNRKLRMLS